MVDPDCVYDAKIYECAEREDDPIFIYLYSHILPESQTASGAQKDASIVMFMPFQSIPTESQYHTIG